MSNNSADDVSAKGECYQIQINEVDINNDNVNNNSILVGYVLSNDVKRNTKNKPEQRQRVIIDALSTNNSFDIDQQNLNLDDSNLSKFIQFLASIHDAEFIHFLLNAYTEFKKDTAFNSDFYYVDNNVNADAKVDDNIDAHLTNGLVPNVFLNQNKQNLHLLKKSLPLWKHCAFYCTDAICPLFEHTSHDILMSAYNTKLLAQKLMNIDNKKDYKCIYSVTTNPGHHAGYDFYGGYCFINNAMVAARTFLDADQHNKVCVLDLDYHASDGTNSIVNKFVSDGMDNILAISLHMNPAYDYPHYRGFDFENNKHVTNILLPPKCNFTVYKEKLHLALNIMHVFKPNYLIIAFGADTYAKDPEVVAKCLLSLEHYEEIGNLISQCCNELKCKILITQEGGYHLDDIGLIVNNFLSGINNK
jgi:acetoin utilization deacetylase AcuC-like enzyme